MEATRIQQMHLIILHMGALQLMYLITQFKMMKQQQGVQDRML